MLRFPVSVVLTVTIGACSGPSVEPPKNSVSSIPETGGSEPPPIPNVETAAERIPWPVATLRGTAPRASRVIVESGVRAWARAVLPDGSFCIDAPMDAEGAHEFRVWAQADDGTLSPMAALVNVAYEASAPEPTGVTRCDGSPIAECMASAEICDNGVDDDCNGRADGVDAECSTCSDDPLEPNDRPDGPRVEPGSYTGLYVCAGNDDFYPIRLASGDRITARAYFSHSAGDIDMKLLAPDGETRLETSVSVTNDEEIVHTATENGLYVIQVYGFAEAENEYTLELAVE